MPRGFSKLIAWALPVALVTGSGCLGTTLPSTRLESRPVKRPASKTSPRVKPTSNPLKSTSSPKPSARPTATPSPKPTPTLPPTLPAVLGQPLALNPEGADGLNENTRNYLVVSAATAKPPSNVQVSVSSGSGIGLNPDEEEPASAAYRVASVAGDAHVAFRRAQAAATAGARPGGYRLQANSGPLAKGTEQPFWVITNFATETYEDVQVTARLQEVGRHCYVFVDKSIGVNEAPLMANRAKEIAQVFDERIYPTNTRLFGAEPNPGVDGDPRIFILLSPAVGNYGKDNTLGFFSQRDQYAPGSDPRPIFKHSNAKEMLFVSSRIVLSGSADDYLGTIAHEFQHMINFNQKVLVAKNDRSDDLWIDEGMAMYAIEANGYGLKEGGEVLAKHVWRYQQEPASFSLTDWTSNPDGIGYGPVYLFMVYLADRFSETIIRDIVTDKALGLPNINALLAARGTTFDRVFHDWAMANFLDGRTSGGSPHHHYQSLTMIGNNGKTRLSGFQAQTLEVPGFSEPVLKPYSVRFYELPRGPLLPSFSVVGPGDEGGVVPRLVLP